MSKVPRSSSAGTNRLSSVSACSRIWQTRLVIAMCLTRHQYAGDMRKERVLRQIELLILQWQDLLCLLRALVPWLQFEEIILILMNVDNEEKSQFLLLRKKMRGVYLRWKKARSIS